MSRLNDFIQYIQKNYSDRISNKIEIEPSLPHYSQIELLEELKENLAGIGINRLFKHQVRTIEQVNQGRNVILLSGTATGKTLAYLIPVLTKLIKNPRSTAFLLFPTKALSRDQLMNLSKLAPQIVSSTYDGDTPNRLRKAIREQARIVLTNPDMMHMGILSNHQLWGNFLRNLEFVVLDESHVYRGAFGTNTAMVMRRLIRIAGAYGADPKFILTTATLTNPEQLAENLTGKEFVLIKKAGISMAKKTFIIWNPPFLVEKSRRKSSNFETTLLFSEAVKRGLRTIVFSKSKVSAELITRYTKRMLPGKLKNKISTYRAGYMPSRRREIEKQLFKGKLLGVSATPALELGIDVGELSISIINRYPGTISSFFQQAGRAGRNKPSLTIYIAGEDPLDQHFAGRSNELFSRPKEAAIIDTSNKYVLRKHLVCSAFEKPLTEKEIKNNFPDSANVQVEYLQRNNVLKKKSTTYYPTPELKMPHEKTFIRTASLNNYEIVDEKTGEVVGFLDEPLAYIYLYPGAVYLHEADTYIVRQLDIDNKVARVEEAEGISYYTVPREDTRVTIINSERFKKFKKFDVHYGELSVENQVLGYQKRNVYNDRVIGFEEVILPPHIFKTKGLWIELREELIEKLNLDPQEFAGGIHGIEHAHISLLPLYAGCDRWDIGGVSTPAHYQSDGAYVFVYDGIEGGLGYCERGYRIFDEHIFHTFNLVKDCPCINGCPSCIHSPKCGNMNEPLNKNVALNLLKSHLEV